MRAAITFGIILMIQTQLGLAEVQLGPGLVTWDRAAALCSDDGYQLFPGRRFWGKDIAALLSDGQGVWLDGWRVLTDIDTDMDGRLSTLKVDKSRSDGSAIPIVCKTASGDFTIPADQVVTSQEARDTCVAMGNELASLDSESDIREVLNSVPVNQPLWLEAVTTQGTFMKQCLAARKVGTKLKYVYENCNQDLNYICFQELDIVDQFSTLVSKKMTRYEDVEEIVQQGATLLESSTEPWVESMETMNFPVASSSSIVINTTPMTTSSASTSVADTYQHSITPSASALDSFSVSSTSTSSTTVKTTTADTATTTYPITTQSTTTDESTTTSTTTQSTTTTTTDESTTSSTTTQSTTTTEESTTTSTTTQSTTTDESTTTPTTTKSTTTDESTTTSTTTETTTTDEANQTVFSFSSISSTTLESSFPEQNTTTFSLSTSPATPTPTVPLTTTTSKGTTSTDSSTTTEEMTDMSDDGFVDDVDETTTENYTDEKDTGNGIFTEDDKESSVSSDDTPHAEPSDTLTGTANVYGMNATTIAEFVPSSTKQTNTANDHILYTVSSVLQSSKNTPVTTIDSLKSSKVDMSGSQTIQETSAEPDYESDNYITPTPTLQFVTLAVPETDETFPVGEIKPTVTGHSGTTSVDVNVGIDTEEGYDDISEEDADENDANETDRHGSTRVPSDDGWDAGIWAAFIILVLLVCASLIIALILYRRRRRSKSKSITNSTPGAPAAQPLQPAETELREGKAHSKSQSPTRESTTFQDKAYDL